jgi:DNA-binding CsgD family transcriptional regulator
MGDTAYRYAVAALAQAPLDPGRWGDALTSMAEACGASSCQLISFGGAQIPAAIAPGFTADDFAAYAALGGPDPAVNRGVARIFRSTPGQIVADYEYISDAERHRDLLYNEFFLPHDGAYATFAVLARTGAVTSVLNFFHSRKAGALTDAHRRLIGAVMPQVARAMTLQSRLEDQAALIAAGALEAVDAAVLLCDFDGCVVAATTHAHKILRRADVLLVRQGRVHTRDSDAAAAFAAALRGGARVIPEPEARVLVVRARTGLPVRLDIAPLPHGRGAAALRPLAMVHVQEPAQAVRLDVALVCRAFGLTVAEAQVAEALSCGWSSQDIALRRGVSLETVHTQVKAVLAKTGCGRRAELPGLLRPFLIP